MNTVQPFGRRDGGHPAYEANLSSGEPSECCCYCGRHTGNGKTFAYLLDVGDFAKYEDFAHLSDDCNLGFYPVGSECAKVLKAAGVAVYTFDKSANTYKRA